MEFEYSSKYNAVYYEDKDPRACGMANFRGEPIWLTEYEALRIERRRAMASYLKEGSPLPLIFDTWEHGRALAEKRKRLQEKYKDKVFKIHPCLNINNIGQATKLMTPGKIFCFCYSRLFSDNSNNFHIAFYEEDSELATGFNFSFVENIDDMKNMVPICLFEVVCFNSDRYDGELSLKVHQYKHD